MKETWKKLKAAPVALLFFAFLFGFMILDMMWPKREYSELENRKLQQVPAFSWSALFSNQWTADYGLYIQDQFAFRDSWIDLKSRAEYFLGKTENNEVIYGDDDMMFTKFYSLERYGDTWLRNAQAVEQFAARHPGKVSFMLAPSASLIYENNLPANLPLADEAAYLDQIFAAVPSAEVYDLRELFTQHKDEYIFYRTDHHWTTHGAWLAYSEFCARNGLTPFDTEAHEKVEIEDFYGTSYSKSRLWNAVSDTLTYYPLDNSMEIVVPGENSAASADGTMYNLSALEKRDKYSAFLWGNNGYSEIEGDGEGSILVVKDSYGNSFAPFLTANYAKVGVVDFRYRKANLEDLMEQYDQVLILYNFQSFYKDDSVRCLNLNLAQ